MKRRPLGFGISWLLALVLMRSLIPAGFMPAWVDGALALIVCDGQAYSADTGAAAHSHHHGAGHSGTAHPSGDDCSYAQSANPALAFAIDLTPAGSQSLSWDVQAFHASVPVSAPRRYRSARGPPALA